MPRARASPRGHSGAGSQGGLTPIMHACSRLGLGLGRHGRWAHMQLHIHRSRQSGAEEWPPRLGCRLPWAAAEEGCHGGEPAGRAGGGGGLNPKP